MRRKPTGHRSAAERRAACVPQSLLALATVAVLGASASHAAIEVDGRLDEPEWSRAQVFTDFQVTQPYTLGTPRHPTEVRMLGTPEGIIVGFRCTHPRSTPRQKEQTPRDIDNNGDRVNVYLDLDADAQVAYNVTVALAGSVQDATITNETQYSTDWDGDVSYAVLDLEDEWYVEMLLPWSIASMKNTDTPRRTIGVLFDRVIGETQERSALGGRSFSRSRYLSDFPRVEIDQYRGSLFHVFPYATLAGDWVEERTDFKAGADLLWKPSGAFQLAAALNPDFGQVEADELVVNFDAIEVLFSDRRPFFAENQALFDVRVAGTDRLLYTRRIGGTRDDDPQRAAEIDAAVKINGNVGRLEYGTLSAAERDYGDDLGRAFLAQRLRFAAGDWNVGYLGTWTDRPFLERSSQVHSTDFAWRPGSRFALLGQVLASLVETPGADGTAHRDGDGAVLQAFYAPSADWQNDLTLLHLGRTLDFNDMGFQQRAGVNRVAYALAHRFRDFAATDRRAAVTWRFKPELRWNDSGDRLGHYVAVFREAQQRSGATLNTFFEMTGAGIDDLISRGNGKVKVDPRLVGLSQTYQSARLGKWRTYAAATLLQEGNDDYAWRLEGKVEHFVREDFNVALRAIVRGSRDWLIWQRDDLLASFQRRQALVAGDLNWFPAANQELRVKLQWLGIDAWNARPLRIAPSGDLVPSADVVPDFRVNNFGLQVRYRWTFAPQSDLYLVYARGGITFEEGSSQDGLTGLLESALDLRDSDQLLLKARYRF